MNATKDTLRAAFETWFATIHPAPAKLLFERVSDGRRYCSMEVEYAWQTYAHVHAANEDVVEQIARKARLLTLEYAAMHFDSKTRMCNPAYVSEYLRELKRAPLDVSVILESL